METIIIPIFVIGLISSIVTELLKLFPKLSENDERKKVVAFLVAFGMSIAFLLTQPEYSSLGLLTLVVGALGASFAIYKSVIQPFKEILKIEVPDQKN